MSSSSTTSSIHHGQFQPSSSTAGVSHHRSSSLSDFDSDEFQFKWRRVCREALPGLLKRQQQVPETTTLRIDEDALDYVQSLCLKVLRILMSSRPYTIDHVEKQIESSFHRKVSGILLKEISRVMTELLPSTGTVKKSQTLSSKNLSKKMCSLFCFPFQDFQLLLKDITSLNNVKVVDMQMTVAVMTVIEYVASEIFKYASDYVIYLRSKEKDSSSNLDNNNKLDVVLITKEDVKISVTGNHKSNVHRLLFREEHPEGCDDCREEVPQTGEKSGTSRVNRTSANFPSSASFDHDHQDTISSTNLFPLEYNSNMVTNIGDLLSSTPPSTTTETTKKAVTYRSVVEDLIKEEQAFLSDVQLVIKVFRETFCEILSKCESENSSANNSLPSSPTSPSSPGAGAMSSGQWGSVPSSPTRTTTSNRRITQQDIDTIFSNIGDIEENTVTLLGGLEDALEAIISSSASESDGFSGTYFSNVDSRSSLSTHQNNIRTGIESIGAVFEELAETREFDCFIQFSEDVLTLPNMSTISKSSERLSHLLSDSWISNSLSTRGSGFLPSVKYVLPKLMNGIVFHVYTYLDYIHRLQQLTPRNSEDWKSFDEAGHGLTTLREHLKNKTGLEYKPPPCAGEPAGPERLEFERSLLFGQDYLRIASFDKKIPKTPKSKLEDFLSTTEGLDNKMISSMVDLLCEGRLFQVLPSRGIVRQDKNRHVFLFVNAVNSEAPGALILTKPSENKKIVNAKKAKEQFSIRDIEVVDLPDTAPSSFDDHDGPPSIPPQTPSAYSTLQSNVKLVRDTTMSQIKAISSSIGQSTTSLAGLSIASSMSSTTGLLGSHATIPTTSVPFLKVSNAFEVRHRDATSGQESSIILSCSSCEEKRTWMSLLVFLTTKSMLERRLKHFLTEESKRNPLQLPDPSVYRFSEPDTEENIVFQNDHGTEKSEIPIIKAATLLKLIERLTYHQYADPKFVQMFLTTYRTFCTSADLLDHLIERFQIPPIESTAREDVKRFEKDYVQPVQFRVLNVIRHWVDQYYEDFSSNNDLEERLIKFLHEAYSKKNARRFIDSINKTIGKKRSQAQPPGTGQVGLRKKEPTGPEIFTFTPVPPPIETFLEKSWGTPYSQTGSRAPGALTLLTVHPIEFARQLTLFEFDLFRRVQPSELVGCAWTKDNREKMSPNLMRMMSFSTSLGLWLQKQIVETMHFDERVALVCRLLEIMQVLQELNNFAGVLEIVGVMKSSAIHRLELTKSKVPVKLMTALEAASDLHDGHHKKYISMLKSINPPCVPFLGVYLTNVVYFEEGNQDDIVVPIASSSKKKDSLSCGGQRAASSTTINSTTSYGSDNSNGSTGSGSSTSTLTDNNVNQNLSSNPVGAVSSSDSLTKRTSKKTVTLINFYKRRKVAEITADIQQYQNTKYCLSPEQEIRKFIESIDAFTEGFPSPLSVEVPSLSNILNRMSSGGQCLPTKEEKHKALEDYLWEMSKLIEPKDPNVSVNKRIPKYFDRRWPDLSLKSPGIKPTTQATGGGGSSGNSMSSKVKTPREHTISASFDQTGQISPSHAVLHFRSNSSNPTTPLSPTTSICSSFITSDHTVFAPVMIGGYPSIGASRGWEPSTPPTPSSGLPFAFPSSSRGPSFDPPPLPPRTGKMSRNVSVESDSPPPLPPRQPICGRRPSGGHHFHVAKQPTHHPLHFPSCGVGTVPPPLPSLPHPNHQRQVSNDGARYTSAPSASVSSSTIFKLQGVPLRDPPRRNSTLEQIPVLAAVPPRRHSTTTTAGSTTTTTTMTTPSATPTSPPPPYSSVISSTSPTMTTVTSSSPPSSLPPLLPSSPSDASSSLPPTGGGARSPSIPELPPRTYKLSSSSVNQSLK